YMDIGTGKDIPSNFRFELSSVKYKGKRIGYYTNHQTKIWGLDIVDPNEEFSVASYLEIASEVLNDIYDREKLPILVGGTGLYINAVVDGIETANIKKDEKLREKLQKKSVEELYNILLQSNSEKAGKLNDSDRKNPRRLIRAIEIAQ